MEALRPARRNQRQIFDVRRAVDARIEQRTVHAQDHACLEHRIQGGSLQSSARMVPMLQSYGVRIECVQIAAIELRRDLASQTMYFREPQAGPQLVPDLMPGGSPDLAGPVYLRVGLAKENRAAVIALIERLVAHKVDHERLPLPKRSVGKLAHHQIDASIHPEVAARRGFPLEALPHPPDAALLPRRPGGGQRRLDIGCRSPPHQ